jgi:ATP-dependent helicase/nuclease subunit B
MIRIIGTLSAEKRHDYLVEHLKSPECGNATLLVPEQFLFETERSMYHILGARRIADLNITGFSKLAEKLVKKYGTPKLYADDIIKAVTMYKTLSQLRTNLSYYSGAGRVSYDFAQQMLNIVADFKDAAITPDFLRGKLAAFATADGLDDLDDAPEPPNRSKFSDGLLNKLFDISEIYTTYCETLEFEFADKLDDNRIAAELIAQYDCFAGQHVLIHEFDSFSASQIGFIKAIAESAESVEILFRTDAEDSSRNTLRAMNALIRRLKREFHEFGGIPCEFVVLESDDNKPQIELWTADNIINECEFVAAEIRRLITTEGYACNDIAVLLCDSGITPRLKEAMAEYDIPCYTDLPESIMTKPITRFIISVLEATSLNTPELLAYIRSGYVRIPEHLENYDKKRKFTAKQIFANASKQMAILNSKPTTVTRRLSKRSMDALERAAFKYALKRSEWGKPFPEQNADLAAIEPLREAIVLPLLVLKTACMNTTGDKISEAVCAFLLDTMQLHRTVYSICYAGDLLENKSLTEEFRQLWDLIIDVFESLHTALKDFPITLNDYIEVFSGVCMSVNIAKPPQVLDAVAIGDLRRSRLSGIRAAFVTGANMGLFPKNSGISDIAAGSFSGKDVEVLADNGLEISAKLEIRYNYERMVADKALTLPSCKLYLTAPLSDAAWRELSPSPFFGELEKKHGLSINRTSELPLEFRVRTVKAAKRIYAEQTVPALREQLRQVLVQLDETPPANLQNGGDSHILLPATAGKLFSYDRYSPTAIEAMMRCRFMYFCKYGLRLDMPLALNEDEPIALERGRIIHHCFDTALRSGALFSPEARDDKVLEQLVMGYIRDYRNTLLPYGYAQTKRQEYILMSFTAGIVRMLKHIRSDFEQSKFQPAEFEKKVNFRLGDVQLTGKIDRVDRFNEYVRVIDYKSGATRLDLADAHQGLNLQMLLYLFGESDGTAKAASALYVPSDGLRTETVLLPNATDDDTHKNWLKAHKPSGIVVADNSLAYDDFTAWESRFCKETNAKSGFANTLTPDEFDELRLHCTALINVRVKAVKDGDVRAVPVVSDKTDVCKHCEFCTVCGGRGYAKT